MNTISSIYWKSKMQQLAVTFICYTYFLLFLYAASSKLMAYDRFQLQLSKSPITTDYAHILVWLVPALEVFISLLLVLPRNVLPGLYATFTLMCLFTAYIFAILNFSEHIPCSCGGVLEQLGWTEHLIFNLVFLILAVAGILIQSTIAARTAVRYKDIQGHESGEAENL